MVFFNWAAWSMMKSCTLKIEFQFFTERWLHQTILFYLNPWVCGLMVFRTTVKNISFILWWSGLTVIKRLNMSFVLILEKYSIRTSYQKNTAIWLDVFGVRVRNFMTTKLDHKNSRWPCFTITSFSSEQTHN